MRDARPQGRVGDRAVANPPGDAQIAVRWIAKREVLQIALHLDRDILNLTIEQRFFDPCAGARDHFGHVAGHPRQLAAIDSTRQSDLTGAVTVALPVCGDPAAGVRVGKFEARCADSEPVRAESRVGCPAEFAVESIKADVGLIEHLRQRHHGRTTRQVHPTAALVEAHHTGQVGECRMLRRGTGASPPRSEPGEFGIHPERGSASSARRYRCVKVHTVEPSREIHAIQVLKQFGRQRQSP